MLARLADKKYQEYLEMVQDKHADDYPEISNILDRFKTLSDADASLDSRQRETEQKMEVQRMQATQFQKVGGVDAVCRCLAAHADARLYAAPTR